MEILRDPDNIQAFWKQSLLLSKIVIDNGIAQSIKNKTETLEDKTFLFLFV